MTALENPYFDAVAGGITVGAARGVFSDRAVEVLRDREALVEQYAWAIPNAEAIERIVEYDPILEVGAGNGYWAWLVERAGGEIVATDSLQGVAGEPDPWTDVEGLGYRQAIEEYGEGRALFICWPNQDRWAGNAVRQFVDIGGRELIYVGEGRTGCTADGVFHRYLFDDWTLADVVHIPTFLCCRDRLEVWVR